MVRPRGLLASALLLRCGEPVLAALAPGASSSIQYSNATAATAATAIASSTKPTKPILPTPCSAECWLLPTTQVPRMMGWTRIPFATTIKATLVLVVNRKNNTTRTSTHYPELPKGYTTLPPPKNTNAKGTKTMSNISPNFTIAYPTQYAWYTNDYTFFGAVPTKINGVQTCAAGSNDTCFHGYVSGVPTTFADSPPIPQPTVPPVATDDPSGWLYEEALTVTTFPGNFLFNQLAKDDAAWHLCNTTTPTSWGLCRTSSAAGATANMLALYLTDTSTSFESDGSPSVTANPVQQSRASSNASPTPNNPPPASANSPTPSPQNSPAQNTPQASSAPAPTDVGGVIGSLIGAGGESSVQPANSPAPVNNNPPSASPVNNNPPPSPANNPPASPANNNPSASAAVNSPAVPQGTSGSGSSGSGQLQSGQQQGGSGGSGQEQQPNNPLPSLTIGNTVVPISIAVASAVISGTAGTSSVLVVGSQTAAVGQILTVANTPVIITTIGEATQLLVPTGSGSAAGTATIAVPTGALGGSGGANSPPPSLTVGNTIVPISVAVASAVVSGTTTVSSVLVLGSQTATVGQTLTVANTRIVVTTSGGTTQLLVPTGSGSAAGTSTIAVPTGAVGGIGSGSTTNGLGGAILSGLGYTGSQTAGSTGVAGTGVQSFAGEASKGRGMRSMALAVNIFALLGFVAS